MNTNYYLASVVRRRSPLDFSKILSWTFNSDLGFDDEGVESQDKQTATIENARLVESYCGDFNGVNSAITLSNSVGNTYNDATFSFWFKRNGLYGGSYHALYTRLNASVQGLQIYIPTGDKLSFYTNAVHASAYTVDLDWHLYEITFSGTTITLNVDGSLEDTITGVTFIDVPTSTSHAIGTTGGNATNGEIACFNINDEINLPLQGSVYDVSGNGNHALASNIDYVTQDNCHYNIIYGFDLYTDDATGLIEIYVPYVDGVPVVASILNYTKQSSHPAGYWHNGAETKFIIGATTYDGTGWGVEALVKTADTDEILHNSATGYGKAQGYDDMIPEQGEYLFMNTQTENQYKDVLLCYDPQTGNDSVKIHKFVGNGANLVTDENNQQLFDENNYAIWTEV
jgi:hypothetical protein